ncbi:MAG: hypothetical protein IK100_11850 [Muribaculaceae bacterium]|nr:hypothetical protein [Muribaculaceae bacterium]
MTKLEKLYSIIENSRDVGVKLPKDVIKQVEELEENIIKEEILPALSDDIAPRLEPIKRELVLVVEYHPGEPISVALSRKAKISEIVDAKQLTPKTDHVSKPVSGGTPKIVSDSQVPSKRVENSTKGLCVTFPDGTIIWNNTAIETFIDTLCAIGLDRIPAVGIHHGGGYNLVDKKKRPTHAGRVWQHECDGWFIYSNISNATKCKNLQMISDYYHLDLLIDERKPQKR